MPWYIYIWAVYCASTCRWLVVMVHIANEHGAFRVLQVFATAFSKQLCFAFLCCWCFRSRLRSVGVTISALCFHHLQANSSQPLPRFLFSDGCDIDCRCPLYFCLGKGCAADSCRKMNQLPLTPLAKRRPAY